MGIMGPVRVAAIVPSGPVLGAPLRVTGTSASASTGAAAFSSSSSSHEIVSQYAQDPRRSRSRRRTQKKDAHALADTIAMPGSHALEATVEQPSSAPRHMLSSSSSALLASTRSSFDATATISLLEDVKHSASGHGTPRRPSSPISFAAAPAAIAAESKLKSSIDPTAAAADLIYDPQALRALPIDQLIAAQKAITAALQVAKSQPDLAKSTSSTEARRAASPARSERPRTPSFSSSSRPHSARPSTPRSNSLASNASIPSLSLTGVNPSLVANGRSQSSREHRPNELAPTGKSDALLASEAAHDFQCICSVCVCGRHHCPETPRDSHYPSTLQSSAQAAYPAHPVELRQARPPARVEPPPFALHSNRPNSASSYDPHQTTNKSRFAPPPAGLHTAQPCDNAKRTNISLAFQPGSETAPRFPSSAWTSEARNAYPAHELPPPFARAAPEPRVQHPFVGESTMHSMYPAHELPPRFSRPPPEVHTSKPFVGESTQHSEYPAYDLSRIEHAAPALRRNGPLIGGPDSRDWATESKSMLRRHPLQVCPAGAVAVRSKTKPGHVRVEPQTGRSNAFRLKKDD